ncbi:tRNA dihydrouridine(20/20a) synthase DusA [Deinococcus psychrotolerans]|uniref:tRNA-dihydrouridine(20/20a) synthase n=1 Tax=Deinococcus psychrotolerans TaxID=2489213 RepID=A0A3G8YBJ8_9DEIO|nr:tRNA dihydrouridine(20/20a) synthase DusA [Deinococcus psychrotolerans]AZI42742.1 tRNA dihydrouridine(20/20a) synthase DusA [Deinococcus psychrotolerans]
MTAGLLPPHTFSVAPMLDWTDRHCRVFHRTLSKRALLYTEMITTGALLHGDAKKHLDFSPVEHPLALQLGGSDPLALAECARMAEQWGYDEINLNCGCPSDRVQSGSFGACLMATPEVVARVVDAMRGATHLPVTVKHRIGIDDLDSYELLYRFVQTVADAGCQTFIVHARKAWLTGLSPKQNREVPPLRYDLVRQLTDDFPALTFVLNGGIQTLDDAQNHLTWAGGVMLGRAAYQTPYLLAAADRDVFGTDTLPPSRREAIEAFRPYLAEQLEQGVYLSRMLKHTLGLFAGHSGARHYKRTISERAFKDGAGLEVLADALAGIPDSVLDSRELLPPEREAKALAATM